MRLLDCLDAPNIGQDNDADEKGTHHRAQQKLGSHPTL
jgi:hypothetical protein